MKRIIIYFSALCTLLGVSTSCETVFSPEEMPEQFVPTGEVTMDDAYRSITFSGNADSEEITFTANDDWKIITSQDWVSFSEFMGEAGTHTITIYAAKSYEDDPRESTLTFVVERLRESFTIGQAKGNVMTPKDSSYDDLAMEFQELSVDMTYNAAYTIEYDFDGADAWISSSDNITDVAAPEGLISTAMTLLFDIEENDTYNPRSATVSFVNDELDVRESFTVSQIGKIPVVFGDYEFITVGAAAITAEESKLIELEAAIDFELSTDVDWIIPDNAGANFYEDFNAFTFKFATLSHDDKTTTRTGHIYLTNVEEDVVRTITVTQDEYNDDAYIYVSEVGQLSTKITEMLATSEIENTEYNRLYVSGKTVALSEDDLFAITTQLTGLKLVDISSTITTDIPSALYNNNKTIEQFIFPETLKNIGDTAFQYSGLTSVIIPGDSGNVVVGYRSFFTCASLESVTIERGVVELGAQSFATLESLTYLFVPRTIATWVAGTDGGNKAFHSCTALKTVTLEEGIPSLGVQAFATSGLEEVYVPGSVDFSLNLNTSSESKAFGSCPSLRKIELGDGLSTIVGNPFTTCTMIEVVIMPEDVPSGTTLGGSVGSNVTGGLKMYVPDGSYDKYIASSWKSTYNIYSLNDYVE